MTTEDQPQIYLITPPAFELEPFAAQLANVLDAHEVACVRLALASSDEDTIARTADTLREVTHARDIALVISEHLMLVQPLGLDGLHLNDARNVRAARKELGPDAIVGAFCGTSRHDGMNAGEAGTDYVCFGPLQAGSLGDGSFAEPELFQWWSEMIEVPVVAEGGLTEDLARQLAPYTDFFGIGDEIWTADSPADRLGVLLSAMG